MANRRTCVAWRERWTYDDRGDIILGWFTRVATFLLLLGILAFEIISLATAHVSGTDVADKVALAARDAYATKKNPDAAYAAAEVAAVENQAQVDPESFFIADNGSVDLKINKTATTLFLYRTDATAKWAVVTSSGHANGQLR